MPCGQLTNLILSNREANPDTNVALAYEAIYAPEIESVTPRDKVLAYSFDINKIAAVDFTNATLIHLVPFTRYVAVCIPSCSPTCFASSEIETGVTAPELSTTGTPAVSFFVFDIFKNYNNEYS